MTEMNRGTVSGGGISVNSVAFSYGLRQIFANLTFEVPRGQVWALMGRSGIGKTTLLNVILGLFQPSAGRISTSRGPVTAPGLLKGAIFRENSLLWWLSVMDNIKFPNNRDASGALTDRALALLKRSGLEQAAGLHPKELSAGMCRRVELIRALLLDDEYFIADEPFTALDVPTRLDLYEVWRSLRCENPRTGIICTHDPIEAAVLCDAVLLMRSGANSLPDIQLLRVPDRFRETDVATTAAYTDDFLAALVQAVRPA